MMKQKILIVDDRAENIFSLSLVLEEHQVEILTADSGNDALGIVLDHPDIAVILLDVQMPVMDGFEVAELIRESHLTGHIPIIFVTAISKESEHVFKGYSSGAVDYLFKPIDSMILNAKVAVFLELNAQKKEITEKALLLEKEIEERKKAEAQKEQVILELKEALSRVKTLSGLLPICANCKKIRDDKGYWNQIEVYIRDRSDTEFTHSICPTCAHELYPELYDDEG